jgi:hypothetical protein
MAAKIVYFGTDTCYRLAVLRRAGYVVENCKSLDDLLGALGSSQVSAILTTDRDVDVSNELVRLVRARPYLPLILFRDSNRDCDERRFDLVIAALTWPPRWLSDLQGLIGIAPSFPKPPRRDPQAPLGPTGLEHRGAEAMHS